MRLRAPRFEEAAAVLAVLVARDMADLGAPDYTLERLLDEWRASEFDLATDAVVADLNDGRIGAYAGVRRNGTRAAVTPECEGRGIGRAVLEWVQRRERELERPVHRQWVVTGNLPAQSLLRAAGYVQVRSYLRMAIVLNRIGDPREPPPGVTLRPLDVDRDAAQLHAVDAASFAAVPDYVPSSFTAFSDEHLRAHDVAAGLSLVAEHGDKLAGFLLALHAPGDSVGYIDLLAVEPDHQRRGLGTALLTTAFALFAAAGLEQAELGVASDNPPALALYERLGMKPRFKADTYERPVDA